MSGVFRRKPRGPDPWAEADDEEAEDAAWPGPSWTASPVFDPEVAAGDPEEVAEDVAEDRPTEDEPSDDEATDEEARDDEPADDEPTDEEPADDEPADDESTEDEPTEDEPTEDEPSDEAPEDADASDDSCRQCGR